MSKEWIVKLDRITTTMKTGEWCQIPYPNHPNGCPNYGRSGCPPTQHLRDVIDVTRPLYFVYSEFDLARHIATMRWRHPEWSERQLRNVLYWQGTSRRQLRERVSVAQYETGTEVALYCPEAHGVNVYTTARINGLILERIRELRTCRHVALLGFSLINKPKR